MALVYAKIIVYFALKVYIIMYNVKSKTEEVMIESELNTKATAKLQEEIEKELAANIPDPPQGAAAALGPEELQQDDENDEDTQGDG